MLEEDHAIGGPPVVCAWLLLYYKVFAVLLQSQSEVPTNHSLLMVVLVCFVVLILHYKSFPHRVYRVSKYYFDHFE